MRAAVGHVDLAPTRHTPRKQPGGWKHEDTERQGEIEQENSYK